MRSQARKLLSEIESGALDIEVPLSGVLRKCVMLGGYAKSPDLQDWARRELDGYPGKDASTVPSYRKTVGRIYLKPWVQGAGPGPVVPLASSVLPERVRELVSEDIVIHNGVASIETLIGHTEDGAVALNIVGGDILAKMMTQAMNQPGLVYTDCFHMVAVSNLSDILNAVRNRLVSLVAEIIQTLPTEEASPTPDAVAHAVAVHITGKSVRHVTVNTNQASHGGTITTSEPASAEPAGRFWTRGRKIAAFIVGIVTIVAGIVGTLADWGDAMWPFTRPTSPPSATTPP